MAANAAASDSLPRHHTDSASERTQVDEEKAMIASTNKDLPGPFEALANGGERTEEDADLERGINRDGDGNTSMGLAKTISRKSQSHTQDLEKTRSAIGDPNIIDFSEDDLENPYNWSKWRKATMIINLSFMTFITPLASSMFAPGVPGVMADFHSTNKELASFIVSVYILGIAFGPMFIAPISELYGRNIVYNVSNVCFFVFTIGCAESKNMGMLTVFRFLAGCAASTPLTVGGGSIADFIAQENRGGVMAIYALGPLMGPCLGPVAGGYLSEAKGWRWVFWVIAIASGLSTIVTPFVMKESAHPVVLERIVNKMRKETGNMELRSIYQSDQPPKTVFWRAIVRPTKMLFLSPIVLGMSLFMAVVYGYLYLLFTTFTFVFEGQYHFSTGSVGLSYLGLGIGCLLGLLIAGLTSDRILKLLTARNGGLPKPEYRLPAMIFLAPLIPVGLFWYGWSADRKVHYIVPIVGTGALGVGLLAVFMACQTYLVDAYVRYAASATAANTILRSVVGALLPLAGQRMYDALGLGWGNSLLGFIALAMMPIPIGFWVYGERLRTGRWELKLD